MIFGKFKKRNPKKAPRVTCLCIIEEGFNYRIILGFWSYNLLAFNVLARDFGTLNHYKPTKFWVEAFSA